MHQKKNNTHQKLQSSRQAKGCNNSTRIRLLKCQQIFCQKWNVI